MEERFHRPTGLDTCRMLIAVLSLRNECVENFCDCDVVL